MANLILSIFERVITILMFIALAVALVCKKKSKKVPLFIIRPIFLVGLLFIMFQAVFVQRNFTSLDKAIQAYDINAKPIVTLQDEKSTYVVMDQDGSIEGSVFPKNGKKWKLPDSAFFRKSMSYPSEDANIDMRSIEIHGAWYIVILPHYLMGENSIDEVHDSAGTEFLKTEYENITVYYGYLKTKPDDYWISVDGDKVAINL